MWNPPKRTYTGGIGPCVSYRISIGAPSSVLVWYLVWTVGGLAQEWRSGSFIRIGRLFKIASMPEK